MNTIRGKSEDPSEGAAKLNTAAPLTGPMYHNRRYTPSNARPGERSKCQCQRRYKHDCRDVSEESNRVDVGESLDTVVRKYFPI